MTDYRNRDQRSPEALAWKKWYDLKAWRDRRMAQLAQQPLCQPCGRAGKVVAAVLVHHVKPHKGDWEKFIWGEVESCCKTCHDGHIQKSESRGLGYSLEVDPETGYPTDPKHPANR